AAEEHLVVIVEAVEGGVAAEPLGGALEGGVELPQPGVAEADAGAVFEELGVVVQAVADGLVEIILGLPVGAPGGDGVIIGGGEAGAGEVGGGGVAPPADGPVLAVYLTGEAVGLAGEAEGGGGAGVVADEGHLLGGVG